MTVSFHLKEDTVWAEAGHEVAFGQYVYKVEEPKKVCPEEVKVIRSTHNIGVRGAHFEVLFSVLNGGLVSYKYAGKEMIEQYLNQISGVHQQTMTVEILWECAMDSGKLPACT